MWEVELGLQLLLKSVNWGAFYRQHDTVVLHTAFERVHVVDGMLKNASRAHC